MYNIIMKTKVYNSLTFAQILEDAISHSRYTRSEFASILQVNKTTVSNWCSGIRTPSIDMMIQISEVLNLDLYYLIGGTIPSGELRPKEADLLECFRAMDASSKEAFLHLAYTVSKNGRSD